MCFNKIYTITSSLSIQVYIRKTSEKLLFKYKIYSKTLIKTSAPHGQDPWLITRKRISLGWSIKHYRPHFLKVLVSIYDCCSFEFKGLFIVKKNESAHVVFLSSISFPIPIQLLQRRTLRALRTGQSNYPQIRPFNLCQQFSIVIFYLICYILLGAIVFWKE